MKRFLLILLILLSLLNVAFTEEESSFELRNGIVFGDTQETVKAKETLLPIESKVENRLFFEGDVFGLEGNVRYDFDEETGLLIDMAYYFDSYDQIQMEKEHAILLAEMMTTYGDPLKTPYPIYGLAIDTPSVFIGWRGGEFVTINEWLILREDYNIKIDLSHYYTGSDEKIFGNWLSFHLIPKQQ